MPTGTECLDCTGVLDGQRTWSVDRDSRGYKTYRLIQRVKVDDTPGSADGPAVVLAMPGLPIAGGIWDFDNDTDADAFCTLERKVTPVIEGERCEYYDVESIFTSTPSDICLTEYGTSTVHDPLTEQPIISGGFVKYTELYEEDRFGDPITTRAGEKLRGPSAEFDKSRPTIRITKNYALLDLAALATLIDCVNDDTLWGFSARCVKLSDITWERKFYAGCSCYFAITYEFEVKIDTFDRYILDEGTKVLNGEWVPGTDTWRLININGVVPDKNNPAHYCRYKDRFGNLTRVILDINGIPILNPDDANKIFVQVYPEADFVSALDVPSDIECP
jgi:hypothetical protein